MSNVALLGFREEFLGQILLGHHFSLSLKAAGINLASHLQSKDLHLSLTLLQNRPSSYLAQRVDSLPHDMRARVKAYIADRQAEKAAGEAGETATAAAATSARKITVPIMDEGGWGESRFISCHVALNLRHVRDVEAILFV